MICPFCGRRFDEDKATKSCSGCATSNGCNMLPCPYCGYEVPKQAPLFGWIARLFGKKRSTSELGRLADGVPGTEGIVEKLATDDKGKVQKMTAMGVLPGTPIKLIRRFPAFVFQAGYSQFAVDRSLAKTVLVKWKKPHKNAGA